MHLRATCPAEDVEQVLGCLRGATGVTGLVHLPGVVLDPPGDLVEADLAREAVDGVVEDLQRCGLLRGDGALVLLDVDTATGRPVDRAEDDAPGEGVDAVVWSQLVERAESDGSLSAAFVVFLTVATLIAAVGLITDSQVLIVGAMVLGPEFTALASLAVAVVTRSARPARDALKALAVGFPVAIALTAVAVALLDAGGLVPQAYVEGQRPLTSFVWSPDAFSVVVALLAGIAGTVSLTSDKASALVGVFISVTTVPAAAEIAGAAVTGQPDRAASSALQLVLNIGCILLAAVVTLGVQRAAWKRMDRRRRAVAR